MTAALRDDFEITGRAEFGRARALIATASRPLGTEMIALDDAPGRIIGAGHFAQTDLIPFARSAMDGYAVCARDTLRVGDEAIVLPITGASYAGDARTQHRAKSATAIATGAPLPFGADAVVPIERVVKRGSEIVLEAPVEAGQHVFPPGDDAKMGDQLVRPGDVVTPGRSALLAAAGHASVRAFRRPRVAVVCTGDEVVPVSDDPKSGQVRNSNAAMLVASLGRDGADVVLCAHVRDSPEALRGILRRALGESDLVITTGGASVGERDLVKSTFTALGTRFAFTSVALRPAKPTAFGRCGNTLVGVLPGNPAAAFVAYAALVRGAVRRCAGRLDPFAPRLSAVLEGSIHAKMERHFILFAHLSHQAGTFSVAPLGNQCSSLVLTSAAANALIVVPPGTGRFDSGATVEVEVLDWDGVAFRS